MLSKEIDIFIVGENYLSYLLADRYLKKGKSVLILDPSKQVMNPNHFKEFGALEYCFIQKWVHDLCPNFDFRSYVKSSSYYLRMNNTELMLGHSSVYQNLFEVSRKFPEVLNYDLLKNEVLEGDKTSDISGAKSLFDNQTIKFLNTLGDSLYSFHNIQNFSLELLMKDCPKKLSLIFDIFYNNITKMTKGSRFNDIDLLLFSLRSKFQNFSSHKFSRMELFHLFLSLISPCYELNEQSLIKELRNRYISQGGFHREATVRNIKYDNGKPWCVELSSFEGVVHPGRLIFIGGGPNDLPINIKKSNFFVEVKGELSNNFTYFKNNRVDFFDSRMVGTDFSSWSYRRNGDNTLNISFMTKFREALKENFIKGEFHHILESFFGLKEIHLDNLHFADNISTYSYNKSDNAITPVHFIDQTPVGSKYSHLRSIDSIGPLKSSGLGLLTSLMEAKDYHLFYS